MAPVAFLGSYLFHKFICWRSSAGCVWSCRLGLGFGQDQIHHSVLSVSTPWPLDHIWVKERPKMGPPYSPHKSYSVAGPHSGTPSHPRLPKPICTPCLRSHDLGEHASAGTPNDAQLPKAQQSEYTIWTLLSFSNDHLKKKSVSS